MNIFKIAFILLAYLAFLMGQMSYADQTEMSHEMFFPHVHDFWIGPFEESKFQKFRDSEIKSAQANCLNEMKVRFRSSEEIWAVEAKNQPYSLVTLSNSLSPIFPNSMINLKPAGTYFTIHCRIAYFNNKIELNHSILSGFERRFDYISYFEKNSKLPKIIGHFSRRVEFPFFHLQFTSMEPNQPILTNLGHSLLSFVIDEKRVGFQSAESFLSLPIIAGKVIQKDELFGTKELGRLTVPFQLNEAIKLAMDSESTDLKLFPVNPILKFPDQFKWGVATSAYQIEGGNTNSDWYRFEQKQGSIFQNDRSDSGPDHWNRVSSDIELLKKLGVQQYRMSIEWARINPKEKEWDIEATKHYRNEIQLLLQNHIEPIITLWHSTLPQWVSNKGGWEWEGIIYAFSEFASYVYQNIAPEVKTWVTLNEPFLHVLGAYVKGLVPPGKIGGLGSIRLPLIHMLRAHSAVYKLLKKIQRIPIRVGIANRMDRFVPFTHHVWDSWFADQANYNFNWAIPMAILKGKLKVTVPGLVNIDEEIPEAMGTQDFYGLNYYTRYALEFQLINFDLKEHPQSQASDLSEMGWEIYPEGLYETLKEVHQKFGNLPILILENGIADGIDQFRAEFIHHHLVYLHFAIEQGIPVENYCYWSLYDNFEWDQGFSIHAGLYGFDPLSKERMIRSSAEYFSNIVKNNKINLFDFR